MKLKDESTGAEFEAEELWCLHCNKSFAPQDMKRGSNGKGNYCPTEGCSAGGIGIDLYRTPWWRAREGK